VLHLKSSSTIEFREERSQASGVRSTDQSGRPSQQNRPNKRYGQPARQEENFTSQLKAMLEEFEWRIGGLMEGGDSLEQREREARRTAANMLKRVVKRILKANFSALCKF
jgi:hypothetical protein